MLRITTLVLLNLMQCLFLFGDEILAFQQQLQQQPTRFAHVRFPHQPWTASASLTTHLRTSSPHFLRIVQSTPSSSSSSSSSTESETAAAATVGTLSSSSSLSEASVNGGSDFMLKEFEKKQAELAKRKESALAQVEKFNSSLQQLERYKQEYLNGLQLGQQPVGGNFSETPVRSAVKAFVWRIVAGLVTLITSYSFSKSLTTALSIVGSDFFSKAFTMFLGERLMNKSQAGRKKGSDNVQRSLTKALVWRLFAICNTLTFAIFFAKDLSVASKIAGSDAITKTGLMFLYERVWARIPWGKEFLIEFSI